MSEKTKGVLGLAVAVLGLLLCVVGFFAICQSWHQTQPVPWWFIVLAVFSILLLLLGVVILIIYASISISMIRGRDDA